MSCLFQCACSFPRTRHVKLAGLLGSKALLFLHTSGLCQALHSQARPVSSPMVLTQKLMRDLPNELQWQVIHPVWLYLVVYPA